MIILPSMRKARHAPASVWTPADLYDGVTDDGAFLNANNLGSIYQDLSRVTAPAVDTVVGSFDDLSGNGNHGTTQSTATRPILRLEGGKYHLEGDEFDRHLYCPNGGAKLGSDHSTTMFARIRTYASQTTWREILGYGLQSSRQMRYLGQRATTNVIGYLGHGFDVDSAVDSDDGFTTIVMEMQEANNGTITLYQDGAQIARDTGTKTDVNTSATDLYFFQGQLGTENAKVDIQWAGILYREISPTERASINSYDGE